VPTAVLDLELQRLPSGIAGLERYDRALALIRQGDRPVGQVLLTVLNGRVGGADIRTAVAGILDWSFWEQWLQEHLELDSQDGNAGPPPSMTLAVCTRDRPDDLRRCLQGLLGLPDDGQELLVIDNAPSDDASRQVVANFDRVRYVREGQPGLNAARNRALREARCDVVAFADDDTTPDREWLRSLRRNFDDPLVLGVTGLTMPAVLETPAQEWFQWHSPFARGFKRRVFEASTHHPMLVGRVGAGANMALRRAALDVVGPFDEALDVGTPSQSGGDAEFFSRALARGYRIVYEPAALNWHYHRRTWNELRRKLFGYGVGVSAAWTSSLLREGEVSVLRPLCAWVCYLLLRSLKRRRGGPPVDLLMAELCGAVAGPGAYLISRAQLRRRRAGR
jgi:GT2 family glycosyltransferase